MLQDSDEKKWIESIRNGHIDAFVHLIELYKDQVYHLAYRMLNDDHSEAETITEKTFVELYKRLQLGKAGESVSTTIYQICIGECMNKLTIANSITKLEDSEWAAIHHQDGPPETFKLIQAFQRLPAINKSVVLLRFITNLSFAEIGYILQINVQKVKTCLRDSREMLSAQLVSSA